MGYPLKKDGQSLQLAKTVAINLGAAVGRVIIIESHCEQEIPGTFLSGVHHSHRYDVKSAQAF